MKPSFKTSQDLLEDSFTTKHEDLNMSEFNNKIVSLQPSICTLLHEQRIKLGISLQKVSDDLRIAEIYLHAIEDANLSALPERVYTLGFIRSYARYLNLESMEIIQRFKTEILGDAVNTNYSMPKPAKADALPNRWLIWTTSIIVASGIALGWIYYALDTPALTRSHSIPTVIKDAIKEQTSNISLNENIPTEHVKLSTASLAINTPVQENSSNDIHANMSATNQTSTPLRLADQLIKEQDLNPTPQNTQAAANHNESQQIALPTPGHIQFRFTALSWVEIHDEYGTTIINRNFRAGEYHTVQLKPGLVLSTGNAGGIDVVLPSNQAFCLGKPGEVLHNVSLNTDRFQTNF